MIEICAGQKVEIAQLGTLGSVFFWAEATRLSSPAIVGNRTVIERSEDCLGEILRAAREVGIDRVWVVPNSSNEYFEGLDHLYLLVQTQQPEAGGERARLLLSAVQQILPARRISVEIVDDLDGAGNPADRQDLLTMVEITDRLTDREEGRWQVRTVSGTLYVFDLTHGNRTMTRLPSHKDMYGDSDRFPSSDLRRDGEALRLLSIYRLQIGHSGALLVDVREDGIPTFRGTTPLISISRIEKT
ncbi:hypothetical protein [Arthrobacter sp. USHLN218]|uniref:hypothetical protein n=1 Tax=Arthrobacter sp. USHLN218 TaxID=3081232 RepID=UPI0030168001